MKKEILKAELRRMVVKIRVSKVESIVLSVGIVTIKWNWLSLSARTLSEQRI